MVQITQTDDEIKITIELNRLINKRPDIILMPTYIKFNNPPIFFERHLLHEIDETSSFCRLLKNEARIVLIKKMKGFWPEIFKNLSKEDLVKKRLEITDMMVTLNKEHDERKLERYEQKRRCEIEREVKRETEMRERVKEFQEQACREIMTVAPKETHIKPKIEAIKTSRPTTAPTPPRAAVRTTGKINVSFTSSLYATPKRESQEGVSCPFVIEDNVPKEDNSENAKVNEGCNVAS